MSAPAPPSAASISLDDEFPVLRRGLYCNHAAVGPWPRSTATAVQAFADENMRQGSADYRAWYQRECRLRQRLAEMVGAASSDDIALLKNTTEGICAVAYGLDWQSGDNVVLPVGEFPSNRLPWLAQARLGVEVREVDIRAAEDAEAALLAAVDGRTRLLSVSSVQWSDGFRLDLERLGDHCRRSGVLFFVDAIQQLGALPLDVQACQADFLAADAHKWLLAPEGIAVFYCRDEARDQLSLQQVGWHMVDESWRFDRQEWTPSDSALRFEAGSPNSLGQAALLASVELLLGYGMQSVARRVLANTDALMRSLRELPGIEVTSRSAPARRSGIVSFRHARIAAEPLQSRLVEDGVVCAVRDRAVRLSPHFYQGEAQMTELAERIQRALEQLADR